MEARERLRQEAASTERGLRDYSGTALLVVASNYQSICAQVGDGAIVVRLHGSQEFDIAIWPENGEYANQTHFVTDDLVAEHVQLRRYDRLSDIVLFSDGLQRIALQAATRSAHAAFFRPLVDTVRNRDQDLASLKAQLAAYLSSNTINARTDDDKSLIISCRE